MFLIMVIAKQKHPSCENTKPIVILVLMTKYQHRLWKYNYVELDFRFLND